MAEDQVLIRRGGTHFHTDPGCKMLLRSSWNDRHAPVPREQATRYKPCPWCSGREVPAGAASNEGRRY